jgi:hypothetical protein
MIEGRSFLVEGDTVYSSSGPARLGERGGHWTVDQADGSRAGRCADPTKGRQLKEVSLPSLWYSNRL